MRAALPRISDNGSFTLISGILGDEVTPAGTIGATVNAMIKGFVKKAAATELPRGIRIDCVGPDGAMRSRAVLSVLFLAAPQFPPRDVAMAYMRDVSNPMTRTNPQASPGQAKSRTDEVG